MVERVRMLVTEVLAAFARNKIPFAQQLVEQRTIVQHRLPQVFGAGVPGCIRDGDHPRVALLRHDLWMVDRDVGSSLIEVRYR